MKKDNLLQLLKTLSVQEKKTFTGQMNAVHNTKVPHFLELYKQYIKLISKGLADSEIETVIVKFLKRNPKLFKDIANIRNYLKEKILLTTVGFGLSDNPKSKIRYNINVIEFLLQRKLLDQAELEIEKAKRFALEYDQNKALIEIIDLQLHLVGKKSGKKDVKLQNQLINKLNHHHSLFKLELLLKNIYRKLTLIIQNDLLLKKKESLKVFHKVYFEFDFDNFSILRFEKNRNSIIVSWYYRINIFYRRILGDFEKAYRFSKRLIAYFESDSILISNFESTYIKTICSFTRVCFDSNKYNSLENSLKKVLQLYRSKKSFDALKATCDMGVLYYLNTYQYNNAIEIACFIEDEWNTIVLKTIDINLLWYCHSNLILFWITGNLPKFKHWLNIGLNISRPNKGKSYYFAIRMFDLMHHLDNNDFHTFYSNLDAFQKTLQNNESFSDFEEIVLSHFRKFYNIYNSNKTINLNKKEKEALKKENFQSLKKTLHQLKFRTPPINYEEILLWCESHLQNKTIKEVFEAPNKK